MTAPRGFGAALPDVERVHHVDAHTWATHGGTVLRDGVPWARFPRLARDLPRGRAWRRVLRADKAVVCPLPGGAVLGLRGGWGVRLAPEGPRRLWPLFGDVPLQGAAAITADGAWYGDYASNRAHAPVVLWHVAPDLRRRPVHVFPTGAVRHVHRVQVDPVDGALWATTGDRDGSCYLLRSDDGFRTVTRHGDGRQRSRATALFFTPRAVTWCTDTEVGRNRVVRLDRRTGALTDGMELPAPVWSGVQTEDGWCLAATGVERGPGVRTRRAQVLASRDGWRWIPVAEADKDRWPHRLGRHGLLWFPTGRVRADGVPVAGEGLVGFDGRVRPLRLDPGPTDRYTDAC